MSDVEKITRAAAERGQRKGLPYAGALTPAEAHALMQAGAAALVDVRTEPELAYVGSVPDSIDVEWQVYPGRPNPDFLAQLASAVPKEKPVMFLCRSGVRSHAAAAAAAKAGWKEAFNVLEGFEGDKDANGHRGKLGGWRKAGLPWIQS